MAYDYRKLQDMVPGPRGPVPRSPVLDAISETLAQSKQNTPAGRTASGNIQRAALASGMSSATPPVSSNVKPVSNVSPGPVARNVAPSATTVASPTTVARPATSRTLSSPALGLNNIQSNSGPDAPVNSIVGADGKVMAFDPAKHGGDKTYTPVADRVAGYQRAISAYQDLNEAREADSLGISQETYRQQKDRRQFGKEAAAQLAGERRQTIAQQAATAPAQQAQQLSNAQTLQLQDIFQQMAGETDPAKIQQLYMQALAMQGKTPEAQYDVARGGQETVTDPATGETKVVSRPDVAFNRFTGELKGAPQAQGGPDVMAEAKAAIAAGADKAAVNARLKQMGLQEIP